MWSWNLKFSVTYIQEVATTALAYKIGMTR